MTDELFGAEATEAFESGQLRRALRLARADLIQAQTLDLWEQAEAARRLGCIETEMGHFKSAETHLSKALEQHRIADTDLDEDDDDALAQALDDLGGFYLNQGEVDLAEPLLQEGLQRREQRPSNPLIAVSLSNLAQVAQARGDRDMACAMLRRAIDIEGRTADENERAITIGNLSVVEQERGNFEAAKALAQTALRLHQAVLPPEHPNIANARHTLALAMSELGENQCARQHLEDAITAYTAAFDADHPAIALTHDTLAAVLIELGAFEAAINSARRAVDIYASRPETPPRTLARAMANLAHHLQKYGDDAQAESIYLDALTHLGDADAIAEDVEIRALVLGNLADLYVEFDRFEEAETCHQQVIELVEAHWPNDNVHKGSRWLGLGAFRYEMGDRDAALAAYDRADQNFATAYPPEHPRRLIVLNNRAVLLADMGHLEDAIALNRRIVAAIERTRPPEHPDIALHLLQLAEVLTESSQLDEAEALYLRANVITRAAYPAGHPQRALVQLHLAMSWLRRGRYADCEQLLEDALDIRQKRFGDTHHEVFEVLAGLVALYDQIGAADKAQRLRERAVRIGQTLEHSDDVSRASWLSQLGDLQLGTGDVAGACQTFEKLVEVQRAVSGDAHGFTADAWHELAMARHAAGDLDGAEAAVQTAFTISHAEYGSDSLDTIMCLETQALIAAERGDDSGATKQLTQFVHCMAALLGADHHDLVPAYINLAALAANRDQPDEALDWLRTAMRISDRIRSEVFSFATEEIRADYINEIRLEWITFLRVLAAHEIQQPDALRDAFELSMRRKALGIETLMLRQAAIRRLRAQKAGNVELATIATTWSTLRERISRAMVTDRDGDDIAALRARRDSLESQLARALPAMRLADRLDNASLGAVRDALPEDSVLVEYIVTKDEDPALFAFCLTPTLQFVHLGPLEGVNTAIRALRAQLAARLEGAADPIEPTRLWQLLIEPLPTAVLASTRWFVATDGLLALCPFALLKPSNGPCLVDRCSLVHINSPRDLLRFANPSPIQAGRSVVFADPDFDLDGPPGAIQRLPGTAVEGRQVADRLDAQLFEGAMATECALRKVCSPKILHIASHGVFDAPSSTHDGRFRATPPTAPDLGAMMRSGIVLAGANAFAAGHAVPEAVEDGILRAEDILDLDLGGTQLVVLSTCDSGVGEPSAGEGVFGLQRAFLAAGSGGLVMSLWAVSDSAAHRFMEYLYDALLAGRPRADAVRDAQRALRQDLNEPAHWGAFIYLGDPSPLTASSS